MLRICYDPEQIDLGEDNMLSIPMPTTSPTLKADLEDALDEFAPEAYCDGVEVTTGGDELRHDGESGPSWDLTRLRLD